jgi:D-serine deaminase-like pyridoxal phosphate-dependent protein
MAMSSKSSPTATSRSSQTATEPAYAFADTPAVLVDFEVVNRNIERTQAIFDKLGVALRPHIKTHRIPEVAKMQIAAGACGITCQKIGEAEVMSAAGIDDILITYNIVGEDKLARLVSLAGRCRLSVTADNATVVDGLSAAFSSQDRTLEVLVECDTGQGRCGVQSPDEAADLARMIATSPGLNFGGLMTYPPMADMKAVDRWLLAAKQCVEAQEMACPRISNGGTPNLSRVGEVTCATEHRAGTYVYNDRSLIQAGACQQADCALTVIATVVSTPTEDRAIIDAGSKALTSDLIGLSDYGLITRAQGARIAALSEEHGHVDLRGTDWRPAVGEKVAIIPNHACVVSNLFNSVQVKRVSGEIDTVEVAARGCSQ